MRLLKVLVIIFLIYFIRRFIQLYQAMKRIQETQMHSAHHRAQDERSKKSEGIIEADFKVVDN